METLKNRLTGLVQVFDKELGTNCYSLKKTGRGKSSTIPR